MRFVIIEETFGDLKKKPGPLKKFASFFDDDYPKSCIEAEYKNYHEAMIQHPDKTVVDVATYNEVMAVKKPLHKAAIEALRAKLEGEDSFFGMNKLLNAAKKEAKGRK